MKKKAFTAVAVALAVCVATAATGAQAAPFTVDSSASHTTLTVTRDAALLGGNWCGEFHSVGASFGQCGNYTVRVPEVSSTSSSTIFGRIDATDLGGSLNFSRGRLTAGEPENVFDDLPPAPLFGDLPLSGSSYDQLTITGSSLVQQQLDFPSRIPIIPVLEGPLEDEIRDLNLGQVFNPGLPPRGWPLNGQTPFGDYEAPWFFFTFKDDTDTVFNVPDPGPGGGPRSFDINNDLMSFFWIGVIDFVERDFFSPPPFPGFNDFDATYAFMFNVGTADANDWSGIYRYGLDNDVITINFGYEYLITSPILDDYYFHERSNLPGSYSSTLGCRALLGCIEHWEVSSPTGFITTRFQLTGQIRAVSDGPGTAEPPPVSTIPEPATLALLGLGLAGLAATRRRRQ